MTIVCCIATQSCLCIVERGESSRGEGKEERGGLGNSGRTLALEEQRLAGHLENAPESLELGFGQL